LPLDERRRDWKRRSAWGRIRGGTQRFDSSQPVLDPVPTRDIQAHRIRSLKTAFFSPSVASQSAGHAIGLSPAPRHEFCDERFDLAYPRRLNNNLPLTMPTKAPRPRATQHARRIPRTQRIDVTRAEFNRVIDLLNERGQILNDLRHNQEVQFKRIAQIQAELDQVKRAWDRVKL
jgi:hypothetical protein